MGSLKIPASGWVYIDANIVIYAVERIEPYSTLLTPLWQAAHEGQISLITSELTWLETLTKPLRDKNTRLEALFRAFLTAAEMTLIPATLPIWEQAAQLRGLGLKTPDALHAATALAIRCNLLVTNDPIFQRVGALPVTVLNTLLSDCNTFAKTLIRETTPFGLLESCLLWNIGQFVRTDTGDYSFRVTRTEPFPQVSN